MMTPLNAGGTGRRSFLQRSVGAVAGSWVGASVVAAHGTGNPTGKPTGEPTGKPRLGVVTEANGPGGPEEAIATVRRLGFRTCQMHVGMSPPDIIEPLREAAKKYDVEITAVLTLGGGKMVWNFYQGPLTIGIIPPATRRARIDALKRASDLGKQLGVEAVHTHCGFIPENPNDPLYAEAVVAIRDVASYCKGNGQTFMMETGQETPITLKRAIEDVGLDNVKVNLDTANLILYDKGDPVAALEVIGGYVHGLHAKDGLYPTDPKELGKEVAIGQGRANFPAILKKLKSLNYTGPITIEREISGPQQQADLVASRKYLQNLIDQTY